MDNQVDILKSAVEKLTDYNKSLILQNDHLCFLKRESEEELLKQLRLHRAKIVALERKNKKIVDKFERQTKERDGELQAIKDKYKRKHAIYKEKYRDLVKRMRDFKTRPIIPKHDFVQTIDLKDICGERRSDGDENPEEGERDGEQDLGKTKSIVNFVQGQYDEAIYTDEWNKWRRSYRNPSDSETSTEALQFMKDSEIQLVSSQAKMKELEILCKEIRDVFYPEWIIALGDIFNYKRYHSLVDFHHREILSILVKDSRVAFGANTMTHPIAVPKPSQVHRYSIEWVKFLHALFVNISYRPLFQHDDNHVFADTELFLHMVLAVDVNEYQSFLRNPYELDSEKLTGLVDSFVSEFVNDEDANSIFFEDGQIDYQKSFSKTPFTKKLVSSLMTIRDTWAEWRETLPFQFMLRKQNGTESKKTEITNERIIKLAHTKLYIDVGYTAACLRVLFFDTKKKVVLEKLYPFLDDEKRDIMKRLKLSRTSMYRGIHEIYPGLLSYCNFAPHFEKPTNTIPFSKHHYADPTRDNDSAELFISDDSHTRQTVYERTVSETKYLTELYKYMGDFAVYWHTCIKKTKRVQTIPGCLFEQLEKAKTAYKAKFLRHVKLDHLQLGNNQFLTACTSFSSKELKPDSNTDVRYFNERNELLLKQLKTKGELETYFRDPFCFYIQS